MCVAAFGADDDFTHGATSRPLRTVLLTAALRASMQMEALLLLGRVNGTARRLHGLVTVRAASEAGASR
jgi:hypothetical protein